MKMTVEFTDVYEGAENVRVETIDVPAPEAGDGDLCDWSDDHLFPLTGDGKHPNGTAGYFAKVTVCSERPDLVHREFEWGV